MYICTCPCTCTKCISETMYINNHGTTYILHCTLCNIQTSRHPTQHNSEEDFSEKNPRLYTNNHNTVCIVHCTLCNNNNNTQKAALAKLPLTTHPHERAEPHTLQTQFTPACTTWPSPLPCETPDLPDLPTLPPTPATGPRSPAED